MKFLNLLNPNPGSQVVLPADLSYETGLCPLPEDKTSDVIFNERNFSVKMLW